MPSRKTVSKKNLTEIDARLSAIVEAAVDAIIVADERGTIQSVNPAFTSMFDYTSGQAVGQNLRMLMPPPYNEEHDGYIARYLATGEKKIIGVGREMVAKRRDGSVFPIDLAVSEVRIGKQRLFTGIIRDVTRRKQTEEALRREKERAQTYLDLAGVIMLALDCDGRVALINRKGCEILGCQSHEVLGRDWFEDFLPESGRGEVRSLFDRFIAGEIEAPEFYGNRVLTRSGEERLIEWHNTRLTDSAGQVIGTLSSGSDVTERERLTQALLEQKSLAKLGEMAAVVAHEVKNPIAGIGGALRIIADRLGPAHREREIIQDILDRLDNLNNVVNDMLVFARPRNPKPAHVPLAALLDQAISLLARDPEFSGVSVEVSGPEVNVLCDAELLKPVFVNLLVNAAQALEGKGTISVIVEVDTRSCHDGCCRISVIDKGPGIPASVLGQIFEPFFTTKARGTGLGLSIAKRILELQGGSISVMCPPGGGTVVHVHIPRAPAG